MHLNISDSKCWFIDTAFAAMLILLTAVDFGLGAYFFSIGPTNASIEPFKNTFGIPEEYFPIGAIAVGTFSRQPISFASSGPQVKVRNTALWQILIISSLPLASDFLPTVFRHPVDATATELKHPCRYS